MKLQSGLKVVVTGGQDNQEILGRHNIPIGDVVEIRHWEDYWSNLAGEDVYTVKEISTGMNWHVYLKFLKLIEENLKIEDFV